MFSSDDAFALFDTFKRLTALAIGRQALRSRLGANRGEGSQQTFDWCRCIHARLDHTFLHRYSIPKSFHFLSTSALVFSSIRISSGQGRLKPSLGHLRVASMPIFEPKLGSREA
jgi:hypothetical protein